MTSTVNAPRGEELLPDVSSFILQQHIIHPVRKALDYYTEMEKALERETQNWAQSENVGPQSTDAEPGAPKPDAPSATEDGTC